MVRGDGARVPWREMAASSNVPVSSATTRRASSSRIDADRHVHVVLLGLMGAGKSTVGHLVANELGRPFVDSDSMVELRTGHLPPDLADLAGMDELHEAERSALRHVLEQQGSVVFAAAASVVDTVGPDDLGTAWCVWLDTSPTVLAERVRRDRHERPLVARHPERVLTEQYERRAQRGRALAAFAVVTDDRTASQVAAAICEAWRARARR